MSERTADELETAENLRQETSDFGLAQVREHLKAEHHPDFDGVNCVGCGDELAPVRIAYKRVRCAACQTEIEKRQKLQRRA
jgi:ribosomal protein S27E